MSEDIENLKSDNKKITTNNDVKGEQNCKSGENKQPRTIFKARSKYVCVGSVPQTRDENKDVCVGELTLSCFICVCSCFTSV